VKYKGGTSFEASHFSAMGLRKDGGPGRWDGRQLTANATLPSKERGGHGVGLDRPSYDFASGDAVYCVGTTGGEVKRNNRYSQYDCLGGLTMAPKKENVKPPTKRELTDAGKQTPKKHPSGGRVLAEESVAINEGVKKPKPKRNK
jgi:hypothetical protein